jgi:hypothetical protein
MTISTPAPESTKFADRIFVLDGGQAHVTDVSQWSPGVNVGEPAVFSNNVYLIRHGREWMVWDTGLDENLIEIPNGRVVAHDVRGVVTRRLSDQLRDIDVDPATVGTSLFRTRTSITSATAACFGQQRGMSSEPSAPRCSVRTITSTGSSLSCTPPWLTIRL